MAKIRKAALRLIPFVLCFALTFYFIGIPEDRLFQSAEEDRFWENANCQAVSSGFFSETSCCPTAVPKVKNQKFLCAVPENIESEKLPLITISGLEENLAGLKPSIKIKWTTLESAKAYQIFRREYYSTDTIVNLPPIKVKNGEKQSKRQIVHGPGWSDWTTTAILKVEEGKNNKNKVTGYVGLSKPRKFAVKKGSLFFTDSLKLGDALKKALAFEYRIVSYSPGIATADSGSIVVGDISSQQSAETASPSPSPSPSQSPTTNVPAQTVVSKGKKPLDSGSSSPGDAPSSTCAAKILERIAYNGAALPDLEKYYKRDANGNIIYGPDGNPIIDPALIPEGGLPSAFYIKECEAYDVATQGAVVSCDKCSTSCSCIDTQTSEMLSAETYPKSCIDAASQFQCPPEKRLCNPRSKDWDLGDDLRSVENGVTPKYKLHCANSGALTGGSCKGCSVICTCTEVATNKSVSKTREDTCLPDYFSRDWKETCEQLKSIK